MLTGAIQIVAGLLRLGKYIRIVPHPVMLGFVNGLAIVIFLAQIPNFQIPGGNGEWLAGNDLAVFTGLIVLTMSIIYFLPKLTTSFPSSLAAIIVVSLVVIGLNVDTNTVGDLASIKGGFPSFHIPDVAFNMETLKIILPYSIILAAVGLIESLLTLSLIDDITGTRGRGNRECIDRKSVV